MLPFLLELDPGGSELLLHLVDGLVALLEPLALGRRQLALGRRLAEPRLRGGERVRELSLPLGEARRLGLELRGNLVGRALARLERVRPLERRAFAGGERLFVHAPAALAPLRP